MRVMILVTHLLGTGHLARALTLARAFSDAGHTTRLVSGGMPAPHLDDGVTDVLQLPPLRSDGTNFTRLLGRDGQVAGEQTFRDRRNALTEALKGFHPDILITELFPFGRRVLKDEFFAALETAQKLNPKPVILSSVRDILAPPSKPAKAQMAEDLIGAYYDAVLVHADATVTTLDESWPVTPGFAGKLRYTGYVARQNTARSPSAQRSGIVVSTGGGAVADNLFETAVDCARGMAEHSWHLLVAGQKAPARIAQLTRRAGRNVTVGPASKNFRGLLSGAAASVSLCGYNTALDVLQTGVPAIFVPFDADGETEQTLRAQGLSRQSNIDLLRNRDLSAQALGDAIRNVISAAERPLPGDIFDGAAETVRIAETIRRYRDA
ncbi:glycosyltransferase family protein [Roseobacter sp. S98]|uniref:glycosyltransferase family protein n=1 Tax=Roseobacter algicola (ex Choi et al. 2025) (nom. illeg.) TaxID=3092138 RepID=UPI003F519E48